MGRKSLGKLSESHKKHIGDAHKGKTLTEDHRKKISISNSGINHWSYGKKKNRIQKICAICGIQYEILPRVSNKGHGLCCSKKCSDIRLATKRKGRTVSIETRTKISISSKKRVKSETERKRISISKTKEKHPMWKGGISALPYCTKFDAKRKDTVRTFFGLCICCGKLPQENIVKNRGQINLAVHHIDHDKEQGCNGKPFNLVPLCNECHSNEQHYENEYKKYINYMLEECFKWGIWSREQYKIEVMYS